MSRIIIDIYNYLPQTKIFFTWLAEIGIYIIEFHITFIKLTSPYNLGHSFFSTLIIGLMKL